MKELRCPSSLLYLVCRSEELLQDSEGGSESYDVIKEVSSAHMVNVDIRFIAEGKPFVINILRWLSIILPFN